MDQNDIDALMNDSPDDEGAERDDAAQPTPPEEEFGELSQADIDAALAGEAAELETQAAPADSADDDLGFSQDDIDALMKSAGDPATRSVAASSRSAPSESADVDDGDLGFDQADIDALMRGAAPVEEEEAAPLGLDSEGRPLDAYGAAMVAAMAEENAAAEAARNATPPPARSAVPVEEIELPDFDQDELVADATQPISLLHDVELHVKIELGRTHMFIEDVLRLGEGSVVELDRLAGDPVDVYVNGRLVARGEVLVLNDNFCVRVSEIVTDPSARLAG